MSVILKHRLPNLSVDLLQSIMLQKANLLKDSYGEIGVQIAIERYKKYLFLISKDPSQKLVPTEDIDEIWHSHMLHPVNYYNDCIDYLGFILNHNPGFGAKPEEFDKLLTQYNLTSRRWEKEFGEPYQYFLEFGMKLCE